jgi:hypothetical protein
MKTSELDHYFVFGKHSFDRMYYGVAGKDISYNDAVMFLTSKEANDYANKLNKANTDDVLS